MQNGNHIAQQQIGPCYGTFPEVVGTGGKQSLVEIINLPGYYRVKKFMLAVGFDQLIDG